VKPSRPLYRVHQRRLPSVIEPEKEHLNRLAAESESDDANCARNALDHTRTAFHCSRAPCLGKENGLEDQKYLLCAKKQTKQILSFKKKTDSSSFLFFSFFGDLAVAAITAK
jgi:hypothetical protein